MKRLISISFVILAGVLLSACSAVSTATPENTPIPTVIADKVIITDGRLEPGSYAEMAFNAPGVVGEVLVVEGQQVEAGQVLAQLENSEALQAEAAYAEEAFLKAEQSFSNAEAVALGKLAEANEAVRRAQYEFDNFDIPSDIKQMSTRDALVFTQEKLEEARAAFEPYRYSQPNSQSGKEFKRRLDDAWADYNKAIRWATLEASLDSARSDLEHAQKEYDLLSGGNTSGETAVAEAQYEAARANLAAARASLANVELRAPFNGVVAGLNARVGETVPSGQVVVSVADFSYWIVKTTDLTEIDVVKITEGQPALVTLDAIPDISLDGTVISIGQTFTERQGDVVYEVTVKLNETLPTMRWGMTAAVKFTE